MSRHFEKHIWKFTLLKEKFDVFIYISLEFVSHVKNDYYRHEFA